MTGSDDPGAHGPLSSETTQVAAAVRTLSARSRAAAVTV